MLEKAFEFESHGQPEVIPLGHDGWHDDWLSPGHGHQIDYSSASVLGHTSGKSGAGADSTVSSSSWGSHSSASDPTLVGSPGGLQIDLLWDSSVAHAPSGFKTAVTEAATYLTKLFSNDEVINLHVGWGEVAGAPLSSGALGESASNGYLTDYATIAGALHAPAAGNDPTASQFFVTSAEAKALGLVAPTLHSVDGYVGFGTLTSTGSSWDYDTSASPIGAHQFDLQAVAQHEITEVMGRIGMEGQIVNGNPTYTPLDLFNFHSPNTLELSANGGYFSNDGGHANLGTFNNASLYGGDIADWASAMSPTQSGTLTTPGNNYDAYDAFTAPGYVGVVTNSDNTEMAALGYALPTV